MGGVYVSCPNTSLPHVLGQYWVGPCLGSFLGTAFYVILKQCVIDLASASAPPLTFIVTLQLELLGYQPGPSRHGYENVSSRPSHYYTTESRQPQTETQ